MDWLQFISSGISSLAWPAVALSMALLYRRPITRLIDRIKRAKWPGFDLELGDLAEDARVQTEQIEKETGEPSESVTLDPDISKLLRTFPAAAFVREFKALEAILLELRQRIPEEKRGRTLPSLLRYLAKEKIVSPSVQALFQTLRDAYNALNLNSDAEFAPGEFEQLVRSARALYELFEKVLEKFSVEEKPPLGGRVGTGLQSR